MNTVVARNPPGQSHLLDVHGLRPQEAIEETERALRNALSSGYGTLKVITGKGLHSKNKLPVLRNALVRAMQEYVPLLSKRTHALMTPTAKRYLVNQTPTTRGH